MKQGPPQKQVKIPSEGVEDQTTDHNTPKVAAWTSNNADSEKFEIINHSVASLIFFIKLGCLSGTIRFEWVSQPHI